MIIDQLSQWWKLSIVDTIGTDQSVQIINVSLIQRVLTGEIHCMFTMAVCVLTRVLMIRHYYYYYYYN